MDHPAWGEYHVKVIIAGTLPPGETVPANSFFDGSLFMDSLVLAIGLKEDGKLLLQALKEKWPEAVESPMQEASGLAKEALRQIASLPDCVC